MACVLYRIFPIISCTTILFSIEDNTTAAVENSSFTRADTLWIYGDSVVKDFLKSLRLRGICRKIFKKCKHSYIWIYEVWSNRVRIPPKFIKTEYRKWPDRLPLSNKRLLSNKLPLYCVIALLSLYKTPLFELIKASSLVDAPDNKTYQWMDWICSLLTVYILLWVRRKPISFLKFVIV